MKMRTCRYGFVKTAMAAETMNYLSWLNEEANVSKRIIAIDHFGLVGIVPLCFFL